MSWIIEGARKAIATDFKTKQPKVVELELKDYKLDRVEVKYTDPYQQAEYAYSIIEEDKHE